MPVQQMKLSILVVLLLFAALSLPDIAHAQAILNVGPGQLYTSIQSAVNAANPGDTVLVAHGTYFEQITCNKAIRILSAAGAASTFIDGTGTDGFVVTVGTPLAPDNSFRAPAVLDGFTIQNGSKMNAVFASDGGGIIVSGNATVMNNTVLNNFPSGITVRASNALIQKNHLLQTVSASNAAHPSTGIVVAAISTFPPSYVLSPPSLTISENLIENNYGAGIATLYATENDPANYPVFPYLFTYARNVIRGNGAGTFNAGLVIYAFGGTHIVIDNLITGNGGAGIVTELTSSSGTFAPFQPSGTFTNNTLVSNNTSGLPNQGTEIAVFGISQSFANNLIVHSATSSSPALYCGHGSNGFNQTPILTTPTLDHNDLYGPNSPPLTPTGTGCAGTWIANRFEDPLFVNAAILDFHLSAASPEIDVGDNAAPDLPATDLDGNRRIQDGRGAATVDIGAYEYGGANFVSESLTSSVNPSSYGQSVTFTTQLSARGSTLTGSVQYTDAGAPISVEPISSSGSAFFTTSALSVGNHVIAANYLPTGTFQGTSANVTQIVAGDSTTTSLTCSSSTLFIGSTFILNVSVTSSFGTPTGSIAVSDNGIALAQSTLNANGGASYQYTAQTAGSHVLVATYVAAGAFAGSSASCPVVASALAVRTSLAITPGTATVGSTLTLTASVQPATPPGPAPLTGTVNFLIDGSVAASAAINNGLASIALSTLSAGQHRITCDYSGSSIYAAASCNPIAVTIDAAPTTLSVTSSLNPAPALSAVNFGLHLATGTQPADGHLLTLTLVGPSGALSPVSLQTDANGNATYTAPPLAPGSYTVSAVFAGTANLLASNNRLTQSITAIPSVTTLSSSLNPAFSTQLITLTASVANSGGASPNASITFFDGSMPIGSALLQGRQATLTTNSLTAGTHSLIARYPGDLDLLSSTSAPVLQVVNLSDYAVTSNPAALTVATGHHTTFSVTASSLGVFTDQLQLSTLDLPPHVTVSLKQGTLSLPQGGQVSISVYLDTDDVIGYLSRSEPVRRIRLRDSPLTWAALPFASLLLLARRPRDLLVGRRLSSVLLCLFAATGFAALGGCSGKYPASTAPGSYVIRIHAVGNNTRVAHGLTIPLKVTE